MKYLTSYSTVCKSVAQFSQESDFHKFKVGSLSGLQLLQKCEDL